MLVLCSAANLRRKPVNMFLIHQGFIDLMVCSATLIEYVIVEVKVKPYPVLCHLIMSKIVSVISGYVSSYNVVILTIERHSAITKPLQYDAESVRKKLPYIFICEWLVMCCLLIFIPVTTVATDNYCLVGINLLSTFKIQFYPVIPLLIMPICYFRMFQALSSSFKLSKVKKNSVKEETKSTRKENSTTNDVSRIHKSRLAQRNIFETCLFMTVVFVLCWTTIEIALLLYFFGYYPDLSNSHYKIGRILIISNSCINPYIYAIRYDDFKKQLKSLFQ